MRRLGALGLLVLVIGYGTASAAPPGAHVRYSWSGKEVVEQQSTGWQGQADPCGLEGVVCNRTDPRAIWDIDDSYDITFTGTLRPGESITLTLPIVLDTSAHLLSIDAGDLTGIVRVGSIVETGHCLVGPTFDSAAALPIVPDSGGGVGLQTTVTWTVRNDQTRPRKFGAFGHVDPPFSTLIDARCPSGWPWISWERGGASPAYTEPTWWVDP